MATPKLPAGTPATWEGNQDKWQANHINKRLNVVGDEEPKDLALPPTGPSALHHTSANYTTEEHGKQVERQVNHNKRLNVVDPSEQNTQWSHLAANRNNQQTSHIHPSD